MKNNYLQKVKAVVALLVLLLACFVSANANPVDNGRARQVAANFLNINRSADLMDVTAEAGFTNVYVFTTENSFVLMAADDRVQPILGYSLNGRFDVENMPDNKRAWIQEYSDAIQAAIDHRVSATSEVAQQWRELEEGFYNRDRSVVVSPLLTTQWNQDSPYNYLCPSGTVTGCVATAMAQIMKYYNYPSHGIGSHTYTHATYGVQSANFQNTTYDWTNMLNSYSSYNSTQRDAVATLMYHCGVSVDMDYGPSSTGGSGASSSAPAYAWVNYFNYSTSIQYCSKSSYGDDEWLAMLKSELNASRPVFYHGRSSVGGHAFIFDGYSSDNKFHVNWGWGGYCDEYYAVNSLEPGSGGIGAGAGIFNENQGAIIGIKPSTCTVGAPTNLNATTSGRNATLTWTAASGAASYNVYCNGVQLGNATSTTFAHLVPYGGADYYVRSVDSNGEMSTSSNIKTVTINYPQPVVNDLAATVSGTDVTLNWTAPDWCYPTTPTATMTYGEGAFERSIGASSYNLYWGHRYLASSLSSYNNMYVYKVSFYANYTGSYRVHVYKGTNGNFAQTQLLQQDVFVGTTGWFDIDLSTPIQIDASQDLWVFMYDPENRDYPCTASYATNSEGDYLSISPTGQMQHYSNYVWLIKTFVSDGTYTYDLYRNNSSIATNLSTTTYTDNGLAYGTYNYYVKTHYYGGLTDASNTVSVNIGAPMYTISATANPTSGGTVTGAGSYAEGTTCTLTASSSTGYHFVNWTKNGTQVSTNASYSFTVTEDATYVANFTFNTYTITASANPTAGGTVTGGGSYTYGDICPLLAVANTGYTFVNWTKNGTIVSTSNNYNVMVHENAAYVANFQANSYTITASAAPTSGGTITGAGVYNYGTTCSLTATANTGYTFVNWTKDGVQVSTNASHFFTVTENASYVAHFSANGYEITATANPTEGGTVSGAGVYNYGTTCSLTATANTGYTFVNWTKDGIQVSTNTSHFFTVTENAAYVANFQANSYTITANANPTAGGTITGAGAYNYGSTCTLTATVATGYTFVNWTNEGTVVGTNPTYSFTVTGNTTYVANFQINSYTITATADPAGGGTISGAGTYNYGDICSLSVTTNPGYTFVNWTKNGTIVATSPNYNVTVYEDASYVAHFDVNGYEITATANPTEGGTVSGGGVYNYGDICSLSATAATGYSFVNWTKNGTIVATSPNYNITVTESAAYVANFQINSYTITVNANPSAGGTVTGGGTYTYGTYCTLTATVNTGYTFVNWTRDGIEVSTSPDYNLEVTENATYVAHFQINSYTISASANPSIGGTVTGGGVYNYGAICTLSATTATGYTFVNWTKNGTIVATSPNYNVTVYEDASYIANFQLNSYSITALANPSEGGTVSGAGTYNHGESCTLIASPATDYLFSNWTKNGTVVSTSASYTFIVTEAGAYVANFVPNHYTITVSASPSAGGSVTGGGEYNVGTTCTISASPRVGYNFVNWTKDGTVVSTNTSYSFTVTEDATYVANFILVTHEITTAANPTAGGNVTGAGTYSHGSTCTLTATANAGYTFTNWTKDGALVSSSATYNFTVTEDAHYVANFSLNMYMITVSADPTAGGSVSGGGAYLYGENCTVYAMPNAGYTFTNWTKNGTVVSTDANYSFSVSQDANLVAHFSLDHYTIAVSADPDEGGNATGGGSFTYGQSCMLTATANTGYSFVNWTKDGSVVSTNASYSFNVTGNGNYVAHFAVSYHTITVLAEPAEGGNVYGGGSRPFGSIATLRAVANEGYEFINWTKDGSVVSTNPIHAVRVTGDAEYIAHFQANVYEIKANTDPYNTGDIEGVGYYNHGETCTLTIVPHDEYEFINWTLNGEVVSEEESITFVVTEERYYIAHLQHVENVGEHGGMTVNLFPNPAKNKLTIEASESINMLEIYNVNGALVSKQTNCSDKIEINVSSYAIGTYMIRLTTDNTVEIRRFVKE